MFAVDGALYRDTQPAGAPSLIARFPAARPASQSGAASTPSRRWSWRRCKGIAAAVGRVPGRPASTRPTRCVSSPLDAGRWPGLGRCGAPRADRGLRGALASTADRGGRSRRRRIGSGCEWCARSSTIIEWDWLDASHATGDQRSFRKPERAEAPRAGGTRLLAMFGTPGLSPRYHLGVRSAVTESSPTAGRGFRSVSPSSSPFGRRRCAVNLRPAYLGEPITARADRRARLNRRLSRDSCCRPRLGRSQSADQQVGLAAQADPGGCVESCHAEGEMR